MHVSTRRGGRAGAGAGGDAARTRARSRSLPCGVVAVSGWIRGTCRAGVPSPGPRNKPPITEFGQSPGFIRVTQDPSESHSIPPSHAGSLRVTQDSSESRRIPPSHAGFIRVTRDPSESRRVTRDPSESRRIHPSHAGSLRVTQDSSESRRISPSALCRRLFRPPGAVEARAHAGARVADGCGPPRGRRRGPACVSPAGAVAGSRAAPPRAPVARRASRLLRREGLRDGGGSAERKVRTERGPCIAKASSQVRQLQRRPCGDLAGGGGEAADRARGFGGLFACAA